MSELPGVKWAEIFLLLIGRRKRFRVSKNSMLPTLKSGDEVLVNPFAEIGAADIVLAKRPDRKNTIIIKRVREIDERSCFFLIGDNPSESTDSRHFGPVEGRLIIGRVEARL